MKLILKNNVDKKEYEFTVTDLGDSVMFYHFENIQLPNGIVDGEYSYFLYDNDNNLVAQGLAQIGDYVPSTGDQKTYTSQDNNYLQYNG